MAKKVIGNQDGKGGRNESYQIRGRGTVPRKQVVKEVEEGKHPNHSVYELDGEKFIRANPNSKESDNVNQ